MSYQKAWGETVAMSGRYLDNAMETNVLAPLQHSLAEYDRLAELWDEREKRRKDFDYYRAKTIELEKRREKQSDDKIARNEAKLEQSRRIFTALTDEARQRMRELINERYATFGAPFTQLVAAERAFVAELGKQQDTLAQWSSELAIANASQAAHARPSRRREAVSREALVEEAPLAGHDFDRSRAASLEDARAAQAPYAGTGAAPQPEVGCGAAHVTCDSAPARLRRREAARAFARTCVHMTSSTSACPIPLVTAARRYRPCCRWINSRCRMAARTRATALRRPQGWACPTMRQRMGPSSRAAAVRTTRST
mmetsp:Transcript_9872/g.25520  ORF Transcript_9872/g.25520 Transcript_9872/m.25520 type:complete len:312 (+) Transcript_9872:461-1396(+)